MDADVRSPNYLKLSVITVALLAIVITGLLIPIPFQGRVAASLGDLVHAPLFGSIALGVLWLAQYLSPLVIFSRRFLLRSLVIAGLMFAFGVATEAAQKIMGRSATIHDAISNGLGIVAAMLLYWAWHCRRRQPKRRWTGRVLVATALVAIAASWWTPVQTIADVVSGRRAFPLLGSFESNSELGRWYFRQCSGRLTRQDRTHGEFAMEVSYSATSHPGATMVELQSDWTAMKTFELDVTLDAEHPREVRFVVKVLDALRQSDETDTFQAEYRLTPAEKNHYRPRRNHKWSRATKNGPLPDSVFRFFSDRTRRSDQT